MPSLGPRGEGWVILQFACLGLVVAAVNTAPPAPGGALLDAARVAGSALVALGAFGFGWGVVQLARARALTALPHPVAGASLVREGPYRFARHPIYGGLIVGSLGLALLNPWLGSVAAVGLLAVVLDLKRRREEAWLVERYPAYEAYGRQTKALVPFVY
ncbi:MAG: isoprenylcysteine carboxylmethyltransferase family protein [Chloroflexi bacterium]|nr:isoprenylcysteine carboxylmethyltransferase family protein [Chloroflexota bacterium]